MYRHDYRRAGRVQGTEQILAATARSTLTVAALDVDSVAPIATCGAQELAKMRIGGCKTGNGQNITPFLNCAQCNKMCIRDRGRLRRHSAGRPAGRQYRLYAAELCRMTKKYDQVQFVAY